MHRFVIGRDQLLSTRYMNPKTKLAFSATAAVAAFYLLNSPMLFGIRFGMPVEAMLLLAPLLFLVSVFAATWILGFTVEAVRDIWRQSTESMDKPKATHSE
jgi:hypothetical protein